MNKDMNKEDKISVLINRVNLLESFYLQQFNNKLMVLYFITEIDQITQTDNFLEKYIKEANSWLKRNHLPIRKAIDDRKIPYFNQEEVNFYQNNNGVHQDSIENKRFRDYIDFQALREVDHLLWNKNEEFRFETLYQRIKLDRQDINSRIELKFIIDNIKEIDDSPLNYKKRLKHNQNELIKLINEDTSYDDLYRELTKKTGSNYIYEKKL